MTHPNLLRGLSDMDNAGVYKLTSKLAIIQHIDYFTPIVDDPYTFGQIAVANALSDVYAMGGKPLLALNVVCFPAKTMDISILKEILRGGADKMLEAGVLLVGGHSVEDAEPKYGISVTGIVHPKQLITNGGAKAGDRLVLTKPLGTGIISTAIKAGAADKRTIARAVKSMTSLNARATELMQEIGVHACTDITGFGFLGHTCQLAQNSQVGINIFSSSIPLLPKTAEFAQQGLCPRGLHKNREFYSPSVVFADGVSEHLQDILFDPQTSGGLFISLTPRKARILVERLRAAGVKDATIVGEVVEGPGGKIRVK